MLTSDELLAVVRVHADRVHDAVRRLGCDPEASVQVVQQSALDLVDAAGNRTNEVTDPLGGWSAGARPLAPRASSEDDDLPLGGGVLSTDANQVRLAEALESRPERERAALLLRDSYDLPLSAVATVLGLDQASAAEVIAQARLTFLPLLTTVPALPHSDHVAQLGPLGRVAEGGVIASRETTARRHVQACASCAAIVDAQERARRLLAGLSVAAMPDGDREALLALVEERARPLLPVAEPVEEDWEDEEPHRGYSLSLMALGLVLAVGAGAGIGALASRGDPIKALTDQGQLPLVTAAPVITVAPAPAPTATGSATLSPSPRVFVVTPSPTPTPTAPSPTPTPTDTTQTTTVVVDPTSGPAETQITVTGQGWTPGAQVTVLFHNAFGGGAGSSAQAVVDPQGTFTTSLTAHDQNPNLVGPHTVSADDGTHQAQTTFTITQP